MDLTNLRSSWRRPSLTGQFLIAGGIVMAAAMIVVGMWVAKRIEQGVVADSAATSADYVENYIAPLADQSAGATELPPPVMRALQEIFVSPAVQERVVSYKIWQRGGLVLFASDPATIGQRFEPSDAQKQAWQGDISAVFLEPGDIEAQARAQAEAALAIPLL